MSDYPTPRCAQCKRTFGRRPVEYAQRGDGEVIALHKGGCPREDVLTLVRRV